MKKRLQHLAGSLGCALLLALGAQPAQSQWNNTLITVDADLTGVAVLDQHRAYSIGNDAEGNGFLLSTTDGGATWTAQTAPGVYLFDVHFVNSSLGFFSGYGYECDCALLYRTVDGGRNWTVNNLDGNAGMIGYDFADASTGFAYGWEGVILVTTDGGAHWAIGGTGDTADFVEAVSFGTNRTGYAVVDGDGQDEGALHFYRSNDAGTTWQYVRDFAEGTLVHGIDFVTAETGSAIVNDGGTEKIVRTEDGGLTWSTTHTGTAGQVFNDIVFSSADTGFVTGSRGTMLMTTDGGRTWTPDRTLVSADFFKVAFDGTTGFAVGAQGAVIKTHKVPGPEGYCKPPVTGPSFGSGIIDVQLSSVPAIDRSSRGDEYYTYLTTSSKLAIGGTYDFALTTDPQNVDEANSSRVWIDWNRDGDFDDAEEEVGHWDIHALNTPQTETFTVPAHASPGTTVMRVYTDMPNDFGHDTPLPCGYIASNNEIGQHGEVEDYQIEIVQTITSVPTESGRNVRVAVAPNPVSGYATIRLGDGFTASATYTLVVWDARGSEVMRSDLEREATDVDCRGLAAGTYVYNIVDDKGSVATGTFTVVK